MKTRLFYFKLKILFIFIIAKCLNISAKDCCDCCDDCFKSKEIIKTTNETTNEPYYDLNKIDTLEGIDLDQDLEKFFIQLLSEELYNIFDLPYSFNHSTADDWKKRKKHPDRDLSKEIESYEKKIKQQIEEFFNKKYIITKNIFLNISDNFIKILATFFLNEKDYNEYLEQCVDEEKNKNIQNDSNKKDISNLLKTDKSFRNTLKNYIINNSKLFISLVTEQDLEDLSTKLKTCKPYDKVTYRGTKIYNENGEALKLKEDNKKENYKIINTFLEKIRSTTWSDRPDGWLTSFSSDPLVAGYFALKNKNQDFFHNVPIFRIVIRNHINKTGVYLYDQWAPNNEDFIDGIPKEKEVLYPQGSKFRILGVRLEILQTYPCRTGIPDLFEGKCKVTNSKGEVKYVDWVDDDEAKGAEEEIILIDEKKRTAQSFACPFIVLDVVEE